MKKLLLIFIGSLLLLSCRDDTEVATLGNADINLDANAILVMVNQERTKGADCGANGIKAAAVALRWNDVLAIAAADHSNDMQRNDYFDHTGLNGSRFSDRAKAAGYEGSPLGENIAWGYRSEQDVIEGWMNSDGHCSNIMNTNATEIGIGRSEEGNYWTMILGKE